MMKRIIFAVITAYITAYIIVIAFWSGELSAGQVTLYWEDKGATPDSYNLYLDDILVYSGGNTTAVIDVENNVAYHFRVQSVIGGKIADESEIEFNSSSIHIANPGFESEILSTLRRIEQLCFTSIPAISPLFCGNPSSMKYHKESHWCGQDAIKFNTKEDAEAQGFEPCGVCKP